MPFSSHYIHGYLSLFLGLVFKWCNSELTISLDFRGDKLCSINILLTLCV
jgi:hypothetical protein